MCVEREKEIEGVCVYRKRKGDRGCLCIQRERERECVEREGERLCANR